MIRDAEGRSHTTLWAVQAQPTGTAFRPFRPFRPYRGVSSIIFRDTGSNRCWNATLAVFVRRFAQDHSVGHTVEQSQHQPLLLFMILAPAVAHTNTVFTVYRPLQAGTPGTLGTNVEAEASRICRDSALPYWLRNHRGRCLLRAVRFNPIHCHWSQNWGQHRSVAALTC